MNDEEEADKMEEAVLTASGYIDVEVVDVTGASRKLSCRWQGDQPPLVISLHTVIDDEHLADDLEEAILFRHMNKVERELASLKIGPGAFKGTTR